jgi:hypothetical protein
MTDQTRSSDAICARFEAFIHRLTSHIYYIFLILFFFSFLVKGCTKYTDAAMRPRTRSGHDPHLMIFHSIGFFM